MEVGVIPDLECLSDDRNKPNFFPLCHFEERTLSAAAMAPPTCNADVYSKVAAR